MGIHYFKQSIFLKLSSPVFLLFFLKWLLENFKAHMWFTFVACIVFLLNMSSLNNYLTFILFRFLYLLHIVPSCWHSNHLIMIQITFQTSMPQCLDTKKMRHLPKKFANFLATLLEQMWKKQLTINFSRYIYQTVNTPGTAGWCHETMLGKNCSGMQRHRIQEIKSKRS